MSSIVARSDLDELKDFEAFKPRCSEIISEIVSTINGNLEFDKNIISQTVSVTFPASANTEITIPHKLNRVPQGYIVCGKSVACDVYDGSSIFTNKNIYLKCTVASAVVKIIIKGS